MLLGPVVDADIEEWDRMIAINIQGLLSTTRPVPVGEQRDGPGEATVSQR
jgi:NADP-dependent 3-hydroxy acid dehydrogenase YdfG